MAKQIAGKLSNVYIFGRFLKKIGPMMRLASRGRWSFVIEK